MKKVLVVAVHPDDETLGCGGTLLRHKDNGDQTHWLILTTMTAEAGFSAGAIERRDLEIQQVAGQYGFQDRFSLGLPTTSLDRVPFNSLVSKIAKVFHTVKPQVIYLPFKGDVHTDHKIAFEAAFSCLKSFRAPFVERVLMMETPSETEFAPPLGESVFCPNVFVDISAYMEAKTDIMGIYTSEVETAPSPRSFNTLKALATYRGATCGKRYAEAFMLLKEII